MIQRCMKTYKVLSFFFCTCQTGTLLFQNPNFFLLGMNFLFLGLNLVCLGMSFLFQESNFLSYFFMRVSIFISKSLSISSSEIPVLLSTIPNNPRKIPTTMRKCFIVSTSFDIAPSKSIWILYLVYIVILISVCTSEWHTLLSFL